MKRFFFLFLSIFFTYFYSFSQGGATPVQSCSSVIPEICNGSLYPAATSGQATAPFGSNLNCGFTDISNFASFYYFVAATNGPLNINVTPTDGAGVPYPNVLASPDLDIKCWGAFNDLTTMCDQLTNGNQEYCSSAPATTQEVIQIPNAVAGQIYVVMVSNWADVGLTPDPCFIQFTSAGPFDSFGGPSPGDAGGTVGIPDPVLFCDTDPAVNLIDILNGAPLTYGYWSLNGDTVSGTFDPSVDTTGTYTYNIPGTINCPSDLAYAVVDVFSTSSIAVTSPTVVCDNEAIFPLTAIPVEGWSSQGQGIFTDSTGAIITDFDPQAYGTGNHNITYTYTPTGCVAIPVSESILINEAPTVLSSNVTLTNPTCFGYNDGTVIIVPSNGTPGYTENWFGENQMQLSSGTYNYTVTDANSCVFAGNVSLYDPLNTSSVITGYNSSCFGTNDGSASITMIGGVTPPGTISNLPYCASNPSPGFISQVSTTISEVELTGDAFNILNNTFGVNDFYEDYTATMYADMTQGGIYTVNVTPGNTGSVAYDAESINVYIDFNIDGDFDDAGENLGEIVIPWGTYVAGTTYPFTFSPPSTGAYGATRMRVVCISNSGMSPIFNGPCESPTGFNTPWFGSTEDYSIVLNAPGTSANFLWDNGSTADSISNLAPGSYSVIVTVAGCPFQDFAVINEPAEINFNPTVTEITCNSFTDGVVSLNPSGGNGGAYSIDWGSANPSSLGFGTYNVTISDPSTITSSNLIACDNDTTITMIEPSYFSVDFSVSSSEICFDDPTTLDFNFNQGGITPFTVNYTENGLAQLSGPFSSGGVNNSFVSPPLGNNTYIITSIVDANGCVNQNTINSESIYTNPTPDIDISILPNPICVGDNSTLLFSTPNGTPPYNVDYTADGIMNSVNVPSAGLNQLVSPTTTTTYALDFVTDSKGCTATLTDNTTLIVNEIPQVNFTSPSETCDGDVIQLKFDFTSGVAPWVVSYSVNGVPTSIPFSYALDSISISPATQSVYTINSITDNNNCTNSISQGLAINTNPLPEVVLSGGGYICDDGSTAEVKFTINSGAPPYSLEYSSGLISNSISNIGNIYTINSNQNGTYTVQEVEDSKGCKAISITGGASVYVNPVPEANISAYPISTNILNPQIHFIDISNGHVDGTWNYDDGNSDFTNFNEIMHSYNDTGTFQVSLTVFSDSGCVDVAQQTIIVSQAFTIYIPDAFTPNNDLNNDYFLPIIEGVDEYELNIYSRTGQRVFSTNNFTSDYYSCLSDVTCDAAWDGKINNGSEYAQKGTYAYAINLTDINGKLRTYEGNITLIR